jgi:CO/xanthine dehydrogenase Mo-binding subunit
VLGRGGFADDTAPPGALVAVPDGAGGWAVGASVVEARSAAGKVQGRRSGAPLTWPLAVPDGDWVLVLQTTWVEPGYLEPDASWCEPGGEPVSPAGNGGAFGGKADSAAPAAARMLADVHGRAVRVLYTREDVVRIGPKRPPVALGLRADGTGLLRVVSTPGVRAAVAAVAPGLVVEEVPVPGPATSAAIRGAGWMEAAVALAALRAGVAGPRPGRATADVVAPGGGSAVAEVSLDAGGRPLAVHVRVSCGEILDPVVARSYAVGAAHMGLSWVLSEGLAVDADGIPTDLTVRSWGVLRARDTPPVTVVLEDGEGPAVNGSDAVMAAVAAATWIADGLGSRWPTRRGAFA